MERLIDVLVRVGIARRNEHARSMIAARMVYLDGTLVTRMATTLDAGPHSIVVSGVATVGVVVGPRAAESPA